MCLELKTHKFQSGERALELTLERTREASNRLSRTKTYGHFIGGEWVESDSGKTIPLENPATRQVLAQIQSGRPRMLRAPWKRPPPHSPSGRVLRRAQRQVLLRAIAQKIRDRQFDYAMMETLNNGKPITDAFTHDIVGAIGQFEYFAGAAFHLHGDCADFVDATAMVHRKRSA